MSKTPFLIRRFVVAALLLPLAVVSTVLLGRGWMLKFQSENLRTLPVYQEVVPFHLISQKGEAFTRESLAGKIWIADFIFTRCAGPCPVMTNHLKEIAARLPEADMRFISFSVDPDYDVPERLSSYAEKFGADTQRWTFLTGDKLTIRGLSMQNFYLGVSEVPEAEREAPDQVVTHSTKFVLVDRLGRIRGYYDGMDPESLKLLVKDAGVLLRNS